MIRESEKRYFTGNATPIPNKIGVMDWKSTSTQQGATGCAGRAVIGLLAGLFCNVALAWQFSADPGSPSEEEQAIEEATQPFAPPEDGPEIVNYEYNSDPVDTIGSDEELVQELKDSKDNSDLANEVEDDEEPLDYEELDEELHKELSDTLNGLDLPNEVDEIENGEEQEFKDTLDSLTLPMSFFSSRSIACISSSLRSCSG